MDSNDIDLDSNIDQVLQLIQRPMKKGEYWYLIDKKWFDLCKLYIQDKEPEHNPGPIDNSALFKSTDGPIWELRERLQEDLDYQFVPQEAWDLLVDYFSIKSNDENHIIKRPVIEQGKFSCYTIVEVYPTELKLCLYGAKEDIIVKSFSRVTTLGEVENEMRRLFNIDPDKETQLWASGSILNAHSDSAGISSSSTSKSNDNQTLNDASLLSGTIVTLEVRNPDGTWPSSRPRYGAIATRSSKCIPGLCGLMNLGNTCFMNSALQCLSNTAPLTEYITSDKYWDDINTDNPLGMGGEIAKSYADLIKAMWSGSHTCLSPRDFKQAVGRFAPQFSGYAQQDCQELMAFLLDGLHEDLNRVKKKPYIEIKTDVDPRPDEIVASESWENYKKRNDSIIVDTFHALLKSTLVCPDCSLVSVTFDPFCYLSLPLPVKKERVIDLTFIPTLSSLNELNETTNATQPYHAIQISRLSIPKYGVVSDVCKAIANALNESKLFKHTIEPERLYVTEVYHHRFHKVFSYDETYSTQFDDETVVYETCENTLTVPVYLREIKADETPSLFGRPFVINLEDSNYDIIYEKVIHQLKNYMKNLSSDEESDSDEGVAECERGEKFGLALVNSFGAMTMEKLEKTKPINLTNKSYLAIDFSTKTKDKYLIENENHYKLSLQKPVTKSSIPLSECIAQFTTTERLGADDPWYCPRCKKHQMASKKFDLWSLPKVLIIHLKRFSYSRVYRDKLDTLVDFPINNLDMAEYLLNNPDNESHVYDLIAVANHYGGLGGGHYTAYAKNHNTGSWHYFDDSNVTPTSEDNILSKAGYVLFYQRRN